MKTIRKTKLVLLAISLVLPFGSIIYGVFDAFFRWGISISEVFSRVFHNFINIFSFGLWTTPNYPLIGSIMTISSFIIGLIALASWIVIYAKQRKTYILIDGLFHILSFIVVIVFAINYSNIHESRLLAGSFEIFTLLLAVVFSNILFIPILYFDARLKDELDEEQIILEEEIENRDKSDSFSSELNPENSTLTINIDNTKQSEGVSTVLIETPVTKTVKTRKTLIKTTEIERADYATRFQSASGVQRESYNEKSFAQKLLEAHEDIKRAYNEVKHELVSLGLKSRLSIGGDTFRLNKQVFARITITGKNMKIFYALDAKAYEGSSIPFAVSTIKSNQEAPFVYKVSTVSHLARALSLIKDLSMMHRFVRVEYERFDYYSEVISQI